MVAVICEVFLSSEKMHPFWPGLENVLPIFQKNSLLRCNKCIENYTQPFLHTYVYLHTHVTTSQIKK